MDPEIIYYMDLPDHILEKILENLSLQDLKNIMLLNSQFYKLVVNNGKLNQRFKLVVTENNMYDETGIQAILNSDRNFQSIDICTKPALPDGLKKFFVKCGSHIKKLSMDTKLCTRSIATVAAPLIYTTNLEVLEIQQLCATGGNYQKPDLRNLKALTIGMKFGFVHLLPLFSNVRTLEKLDVSDFPPDFYERLITQQPNLKELKLKIKKNPIQDPKLFWKDVSSNPFQLSVFHYANQATMESDVAFLNLAKFLKAQPSIEDLALDFKHNDCGDFLKSIIPMTKLQKLTINFKNTLNHHEVLQIKNTSLRFMHLTTICLDRAIEIVNCFVGLESLEIHLGSTFVNVLNRSFNNSPKLTNIKVIGGFKCFFPNLARAFQDENLKEIELINVLRATNLEAWTILSTNNLNITSIVTKLDRFAHPEDYLHREFIDNEVIEVIVKNFKKLEKLEFTGCAILHLNQKTIQIICENCKHLKILNLKLMGMKEDYYGVLESCADKLKDVQCKFTYHERSEFE